MTNKQFQTLVRAVFVAGSGWVGGGENSMAQTAPAIAGADKFLEKEGFGKDEGGQDQMPPS